MDNGGQQRLTRGLKKYTCELTLDTNTMNKHLEVLDNNKKVKWADGKQTCPDHPDRFDHCKQILCTDGVTGRCYWEVEWEGEVEIAVAYNVLRRKGNSADCKLGENNHSWSLSCSGEHYTLCHNNVKTDRMSFLSVCNKVAVYVDCPAGTLSFYRANSDPLVHLYTFRTTFTGPLYPAFGLQPQSTLVLC